MKKSDEVWVKADDMAQAILEIEEHYKKRELEAVRLINEAMRLALTACSEKDMYALNVVQQDAELYAKGEGQRTNKEKTENIKNFARKKFHKLSKELTLTKRREMVNESLYEEYGYNRGKRWLPCNATLGLIPNKNSQKGGSRRKKRSLEKCCKLPRCTEVKSIDSVDCLQT